MDATWSPETRAVVLGRPERAPGAALTPPLQPGVTYLADGSIGYGREDNETWAGFESAVGSLEGGLAVAFASGMAAVAAVLDQLPAGASVVAGRPGYNGVSALLQRRSAGGHLRVQWVNADRTEEFIAAASGADLIWIESPVNPTLVTVDVAAIARAGHEAGSLVAVDNTIATPLRQQPLALGADFSVHAATKSLSGHADLLMGVAVAASAERRADLLTARRLAGSVPGPFEAWLALRGLRTLPVRLQRSEASASYLAERLKAHPLIETVRSADGPLLAVTLSTLEAAETLCRSTQLWAHATSFGGVESTLERRRRWPEEPVEVPDELVRLSVGLEDPADLWADLEAALARAGA